MAPIKRTAATAGVGEASPAKTKRAAKAALQGRIAAVTDALRDDALMPESLPVRVREMLASGAPHALATAVEDRHEVQTALFGFIREALTEAAGAAKAKIETSREEAAAAASQAETAEAAGSAAETAVEEAEAAAAAQKQVLSEKADRIKAVEKEVKAIEGEGKANDKAHAANVKEKERITGLEEETLNGLLAGQFEHSAKKVSGKLVKDLEKLGADPSLLASAPAVLLKSSSERQGFDDMVINSLRTLLKDKAAAAEAKCQETEAVVQARQTRISEKQAEVEAKRGERAADMEELQRLEGLTKEAAAARKSRERALCDLRDSEGEKKEAIEAAEAAEAQLKAAVEAFEELATRSAEAPQEAAAEAPAEPAAGAAAAAADATAV